MTHSYWEMLSLKFLRDIHMDLEEAVSRELTEFEWERQGMERGGKPILKEWAGENGIQEGG